MYQKLANTFQKRASQFGEQAALYSRKNNRISGLRIVVFIMGIIGIVYFANAKSPEALTAISFIFLISFGLIVKYHNKSKAKGNHLLHLEQINREELQRMEGDLRSFEGGEKYASSQHPYTSDLDIFGQHSLFQLVNRSHTGQGRRKLAEWLKNAADKTEIIERQAAIRELGDQLDWRQDFQAYGMEVHEEENDIMTLLRWIQEPDALKNHTLYMVLLLLLPPLAILAIVLFFTGTVSAYVPLLAIVATGLVLWSVKDIAIITHKKTTTSIKVLAAYRFMIQRIEASTFEAALLQNLQEKFHHQHYIASREVDRLQNILHNFDNRANMLYHIFNIILLLDVYWLRKADRWKIRNRAHVSQWFEAISEIEALNSLAGFHYAHPDFTSPAITDHHYTYTAQNLGHCLIRREERVSNDFNLQGKGEIAIITGSNMAGKSTFLRTVGINAVLAVAGAPVCASQMEISRIQVFTSMRTQDSLEESVSSFYAELRRLKQLLETVAQGEPVLFLLDEILKGTNSHDRHQGAASLVKQLSQLNAMGLVSTHDLELGQLAADMPNIKNYSFDSTIENDEILFDYKLHEGICQSFNASKLMEKMGIAIEKEGKEME